MNAVRKAARLAGAVLTATASLNLIVGNVFADTSKWYLDHNSDTGVSHPTGTPQLHGTSATLSFGQLQPANNCLIIGLAGTSYSSGIPIRQLQVGILKCNNMTLSGGCGVTSGAKKFVEAFNGVYSCFEHGSATASTGYPMTVRKQAGTSTWLAYFGSSDQYGAQEGFNQNVAVAGWGEQNSNPSTPCDSSWKGSGTFANWQYYNETSGWHSVAAAAGPDTHCWILTSLSGSGFSVSHS